MNPIAASFLAVAALSLLAVPRKYAFVPLIAGACYMTLAQAVEIGSLTFSVWRLLIVVGFLRVLLRGERLAGAFNGLDLLMILWSAWNCAASFFHEDPSGELITRLGTSYDACGTYFLLRIWCASAEDVSRLCAVTALILGPVAATMLVEQIVGYNVFSIFGGVPDTPMLREGRVRAFGPFTHPILAGTVGAVCLPLMVGLWRQRPLIARFGALVCLVIVVASGSSGPILSAAAGVGALWLWRYRQHTRFLRRAAVAGYLLLALVMKDPAYYIIARLDVVGGSTGWHRAALIEASIRYLNEWWLFGTDYTRHWMPTGVSWSPNHTDITNHYLHFGVLGGLPLMFLFIAILWKAFSIVGRRLASSSETNAERFAIWAMGSALFAQAATCISVSYFDQSVFFLYLTLAAIGSMCIAQEKAATASENGTPVARRLNFNFGRRQNLGLGGDTQRRTAMRSGTVSVDSSFRPRARRKTETS